MRARTVLARSGSGTLVVLAGSAAQTRAALTGIMRSSILDVEWIRLTQGPKNGHLIGKLVSGLTESVDIERAMADGAPAEIRAQLPMSHALLLECMVPFEPKALVWPASAALASGSSLQLAVHKRPYVHDLSGYYLRLQSLGDLQSVQACVETFREQWERNGFHAGHLRTWVETTEALTA